MIYLVFNFVSRLEKDGDFSPAAAEITAHQFIDII